MKMNPVKVISTIKGYQAHRRRPHPLVPLETRLVDNNPYDCCRNAAFSGYSCRATGSDHPSGRCQTPGTARP